MEPAETPFEIPGTLVTDEDKLWTLTSKLATLCTQDEIYWYPGVYAASLGKWAIENLEKQQFWVCEKPRGARVLVFTDKGHSNKLQNQSFYLVDRELEFYHVENQVLPAYYDSDKGMDHTLLDCDLIEEADPNDPEKKHFELLVFDCLAIGGVPKNNLPMKSRYDILKRAIIPPYDKLLIEKPHWKDKMPLRLKLKKMSPLSEIRKVYLEEMPNLNHKTNGLILTGVNSKFGQGKYTEVYKWKPSIDISINLKLKLNYPANLHDDSLEDEFKKKATLETNHAEKNIKPKFSLYSRYRGEDIFFSELDISDNDWKTLKCSDIELEESIVEVKWDFQKFDWKFSRFREDRHQANNKLTVDEIIECLKFKLEFDDLCRILESNEKIKNVNNQSSN